MKLPFGLRRFVGSISQLIFMDLSWCKHCGRTWNICAPYDIPYETDTRRGGCFAVCSDCYADLSVEDRKRYYSFVIMNWWGQGRSLEECLEIKRQVYGHIESED